MIFLGAALGLVALIAWACSGVAGGGQHGRAASGPAPMPRATVTVTLTPTRAMPITPSPGPRRPGNACARRDLVVTLSGTHPSYPRGHEPAFTLSAVNTGKTDCTIDLGPRALPLVVTSGSDRIWSDADCAHAGGSHVHELHRGVPFVRTVRWSRWRSFPHCRHTTLRAVPGVYVARIRGHELASKPRVFRLR